MIRVYLTADSAAQRLRLSRAPSQHCRPNCRARRLQAVVRQLGRMLQYRRDVFD